MPVVRLAVLRLLLALSIALCVTDTAHAQLLLMREHERLMDSGRMGLGFDLNTFFGNADGAGYSLLQPTAMAAFRFREVVIEGALPFAYFHENNQPGKDYDRAALGNPWAALLYLPDCDCGLSRLSLGVAAPVVGSGDKLEMAASWLARGANGDWDGYLWRPDMLPLVVGASTLKELGRFQFVWDADLVFGMPGGGRDFDFGAQMAGEADVMFGWQSMLGARIAGTLYPTLPGDAFQSSITTFFRYMRTQDSFALRFVLNLDPPFGFSFSRDGMWGAGLLYARSFF